MKKIMLLVLVLALALASVSLAAEDTWTTKTDMPTRRYVVYSSVVDGKIYAIGGDGGYRASIVEAYDPLTDTWTRKADMPMRRGAASSSVVNGRIYVMGGRPSLNGANIPSVIEYDATTDTWATKANMMPTPRTWLSSSVVDGKIYAIGGALTYQGTALSTVGEYDPATDTWTSKADMPTPRACVSTSAVNGKIYAIGGTLSNPWYQGLSTVEEYDPATDTWSKKADMPTGRTYLSTCVVNGRIYAIGGLTTSGNHLAPVEEYDPATDTWTRKADMPTARSGLATSAVNGKIYAIGGWASSGTLSTVEEYDPNPLVVDFNGDGIVDCADMCMMIDHWGTDEPLYDIGPRPFGDGIVDVQDLIVLSEHLFEEILPPELVAYWKFDETEGDIAYDSAAVNDAVVFGGAVWQPDAGKVNGALHLDGIDDCVSTPFVLNPADGPFSVFAWIKGGAPGQVVISQTSGVNWLSMDSAGGNLITELRFIGGRVVQLPLLSQTAITNGEWHRVGVVWDGAYRALYVDDTLVAEDSQPGLADSLGGLNIGCGSDLAAGTFFSGLIDDVRIYNRALRP
ncbi:MAG: Kelch repeat-containing protein [Planctomycetota bacterium]|jgi:N-acetylneuraminic acid mutarotase